jgi:putative hydrolase of the HAD superfamily
MIKNLLLDMGGVILDVSYQRVIETFKSYGIENFDKVYTQAKQVEIIDLFEEGKCSAEEFREGVRNCWISLFQMNKSTKRGFQ